MKRLFQSHPDPALQRHWMLAQVGLFLLPFSILLSGAFFLIVSFLIWQQQFALLSRQFITRAFALLGTLMIGVTCFASNPDQAFIGLFNFLPFFLLFIPLSYLIQSPTQFRRLAWIFVLTSIPVNLIGFAQLYLHWGGYPSLLWGLLQWQIDPGGTPIGRMASIFTYATILANYSVVVFVLGLGLWIDQPKSKAFLFPILLFNAIALVLTNSRNAWAIAVIACIAFALYQGWKWMIAGVSAIAGVVLGAAFAPAPISTVCRVVVPRFFWARLNDQMYTDRPYVQLRSTQWKFAWSLTQQRPLTGWGFRSFTHLYDTQMHYWLGHPHNLFFMLSAETGLLVAVLFYGLVGWVMAHGVLQWRVLSGSDRRLYFMVFMAFVACTLFSFLDVTLFDARINLMGWILLSGICGMTPLMRREKI